MDQGTSGTTEVNFEVNLSVLMSSGGAATFMTLLLHALL
jgi:hypothetical protein